MKRGIQNSNMILLRRLSSFARITMNIIYMSCIILYYGICKRSSTFLSKTNSVQDSKTISARKRFKLSEVQTYFQTNIHI